MLLSRRHFLASTTAALSAAALPRFTRAAETADASPIRLIVDSRVLDVRGKPATVFGMIQPNGTHGLIAQAGQRFQATVENRLAEPTLIHWHGQTPPNAQDGVPGISQAPIAAGASYAYDYPLRPGTHWMHSHHGLQEQRLMAAPMIVREDPNADVQEVVVLLHDFSFTDPAEQLSKLTGMTPIDHATMHHGGQIPANSGMDETAMHQMHMQMMQSGGGMAGMQHGAHGHEMSGMGGMSGMALSHPNDVDYDAYLANDRTLDDPEVTRVEPGGRVRLRIINGATTTAFFIELPGLLGQIVAVDGNAIKPVPGSSFPIGMGQRLDIVVTLPRQEGAWPILARREGDTNQTGIILATRKATIGKIASLAKIKAGIVSLDLERKLSALVPLAPRPTDRRLMLSLDGSMMGYKWTLNGAEFGKNTPLPVSEGQRVELTFMNHSDMMHPMHLHGHHYQVVAIGGQSLAGARRDTVMVPSMSSVTVAFDADNPGEWVLHCHNLFHMAAGMMTTIKYV
jgi:FtsP/CotA-like multicopper oxidase with cupredoxin domain